MIIKTDIPKFRYHRDSNERCDCCDITRVVMYDDVIY